VKRIIFLQKPEQAFNLKLDRERDTYQRTNLNILCKDDNIICISALKSIRKRLDIVALYYIAEGFYLSLDKESNFKIFDYSDIKKIKWNNKECLEIEEIIQFFKKNMGILPTEEKRI